MQISFVRGRVSAAEHFALDPSVPFAIVVIEDATQAPPFPISASAVDVVPLDARCRKYFAIFATPAPADVPKLVGKTVAGVVGAAIEKGELQQDDRSECVLIDGLDHVVAGAKKISGNWRIAEDAVTLAAVARARALFEPDATKSRGYALTPIDSELDRSLGEMKSRGALALAVTMRMYPTIRRNSAWRHDPTAYSLFAEALFDDAWPRDEPPAQLVELLWSSSPTKARARLLELLATRPALVANVLAQSPLRVEATSLLEELTDAGTTRFSLPPRLPMLGTEAAFLERHRADAVGRDVKEIDKGIAAEQARREKGIVDGWSLVRWIAQNKVAARGVEGMRISIVGETSKCCDVSARISEDVLLEATVGCDAEAYAARCAAPPGTITATGVVRRAIYRAYKPKDGGPERRTVALELEHASIVDGGQIPAPTPLDPTPAASGARMVATAQSSSPPPAAEAPASSGCGCAIAADADAQVGLGLLSGALALVSCLRRVVMGRRKA